MGKCVGVRGSVGGGVGSVGKCAGRCVRKYDEAWREMRRDVGGVKKCRGGVGELGRKGWSRDRGTLDRRSLGREALGSEELESRGVS